MKLFTGTCNNHKYAIKIDNLPDRILHDRDGNQVNLRRYEAECIAADGDGEVRFSFSETYDARWGERTPEGIKREMLNLLRRDIDEAGNN